MEKKYIKSFPSKKFAPSDYDKNLLSIYETMKFGILIILFWFDPFFLEDLTKIFKTSYAASFGNISVSNLSMIY